MDEGQDSSSIDAGVWTSAAKVIQILSGRWTLAVLAQLTAGGRRYQDRDEALGSLSHKILTETLRRAERDGLVARYLDPGRVETTTLYQLTELGRSPHEPATALARWVGPNWAEVEVARDRWSGRSSCRCPREICLARYRGRSAMRAVGHLDSERSDAELWDLETVDP